MVALEEKCRDMELVIEEMSKTFLNFSDSLLQSGSVNPKILRPTMETFLQLSQRAARELGEESVKTPDDIGEESDTPTRSTELIKRNNSGASKIVASREVATRDHSLYSSEDPMVMSQDASDATPRASGNGDLSNFEPLVDYSLWGLPKQSTSTDETCAIPYILAGRDSFASRLYFETIVLTVAALQGERPREIVQSIFRYKMQFANSSKILGCLSKVLNLMLHGTSQNPNRSGGEDMFQGSSETRETTKKAIMRIIGSQGSTESDYLSSWEVEQYLRNRWSLGIDSKAVRVHPFGAESLNPSHPRGELQRPLSYAPTIVPGFSGPEQIILDVQPLVEALSRVTVSIGEGPRWHFPQVDHIVQCFLAENMQNGCP